MLGTLRRISEERADAVLTEAYIDNALKLDETMSLLEEGTEINMEDPIIADIIEKLPEDNTTDEVIARIVDAEGDPDVNSLIMPVENLG